MKSFLQFFLEYRHNLADGTPSPSIQVHNGKNPNIVGPDKKKIHTVGPYQVINKKLKSCGILTMPEMQELGLQWENGKTIEGYKNIKPPINIIMSIGPGGQCQGKVVRA